MARFSQNLILVGSSPQNINAMQGSRSVNFVAALYNKKAVLLQGNRAMPQLFFLV